VLAAAGAAAVAGRCSRIEDIAVADCMLRIVGSPGLVLRSPAADSHRHSPAHRIGSGCSRRIAGRAAGTAGTAAVGRIELQV
jgi:hypothetical protein